MVEVLKEGHYEINVIKEVRIEKILIKNIILLIEYNCKKGRVFRSVFFDVSVLKINCHIFVIFHSYSRLSDNNSTTDLPV